MRFPVLFLLCGASTALETRLGSLPQDLEGRQLASPANLTVDLGYEVYRGLRDNSTGLNTWKGIRFAAPPTGSLRWQAPQAPALNRSQVILASEYGPSCPQSPPNDPLFNTGDKSGTEDCLFLNVQAPPDAKDLPVVVWIHGGGFSLGNGQQSLDSLINNNNKQFIGVSIQYRLGAFGFLASNEVHQRGTVNAGLLDQNFAFQWIQRYIEQFGGDPSKVTIMGVSAGAASVMIHSISYGGSLGTSLFRNSIAASPYLPVENGYSDWIPSQLYYSFAYHSGCFSGQPYMNQTSRIFDCLVSKPFDVLQDANFKVSTSGPYGTYPFSPVKDGSFIPWDPTKLLQQQRVNGEKVLAGNNAEEGIEWTPSISTEEDLVARLEQTYPLLTASEISKILTYYPSSNASTDPSAPKFATLGDSGPTATNQSDTATGQLQRAANIFAESTFVCASYWLAEAYASATRKSYKYQFSVAPALHGIDMAGYLGGSVPNLSPQFQNAFMKIMGQFIITGDPSIPEEVATGGNYSIDRSPNPASNWPAFTVAAPLQLNLNQTGGVPRYPAEGLGGPSFNMTWNATEYVGPGLRNDFKLVDAYNWEGGRGMRCDFWRGVGAPCPLA